VHDAAGGTLQARCREVQAIFLPQPADVGLLNRVGDASLISLDEVPGGAACFEIISSSACVVPGLSPGCRFWAEIWFVALENIEICKGDVERLVGTGLSRGGGH
jgi:hypothetical protein